MGDRKYTIGSRLGGLLADEEEAMMASGEPSEYFDKLKAISEMYKNFALGGLSGFKEDFEAAYQGVKAAMKEDYDYPEPYVTPTPNGME